MYQCYNEAIAYLKKRLGVTLRYAGTSNEIEVYDVSKLENQRGGKYHDELVIHTLLGQYYLGMSAKKELYFKLKDLEVIK